MSWGVGLGRGCGWKSGKACLMLIVLVGMTALSLSGVGWDGVESVVYGVGGRGEWC